MTAPTSPRRTTIFDRLTRVPRTQNGSNGDAQHPTLHTSAYFGVNTFGARQMRDKLPKDVHDRLTAAIRLGRKLDLDVAPAVAQVIKECASGADLLILPVRRPSSDLLDPELDAVLAERSHPTVLIPEPHPTRQPEHDLTPDRVGGRLG